MIATYVTMYQWMQCKKKSECLFKGLKMIATCVTIYQLVQCKKKSECLFKRTENDRNICHNVSVDAM